MDNINVEALISLIEDRPVIWDKTSKIYGNKVYKNRAWREICVLLNEGYKFMDKNQRRDFGKLILKKWTHIRDSWSRDYKKRKMAARAGISLGRSYRYYNHMLFLKKVFDNKSIVKEENTTYESGEEVSSHTEEKDDTATLDKNEVYIERNHLEEDFMEEECEIPIKSEQTKSNFSLKGNHGTISDAVMEKFLDYIKKNQQNEDDPHLNFFKSLLPITATLDADEFIQFQASVIDLLQRIRSEKISKSFTC